MLLLLVSNGNGGLDEFAVVFIWASSGSLGEKIRSRGGGEVGNELGGEKVQMSVFAGY